MRQRGRKSAASLLVVNVGNASPRLPTPTGLNTKERVVFEALVNTCNPDHFRKSDVPLLVSYVQSCLLSHRLARTAKIKEWEVATRTQLALSTKLRLNPHTRTDPKVIARQQHNVLQPWQRKKLGWPPDPTDPVYDSTEDDDGDN